MINLHCGGIEAKLIFRTKYVTKISVFANLLVFSDLDVTLNDVEMLSFPMFVSLPFRRYVNSPLHISSTWCIFIVHTL